MRYWKRRRPVTDPDPNIKSVQADGMLCVYDERNEDEAWIEGDYVTYRE